MSFRAFLLITLCISISQTRKLPHNNIEEEGYFGEEDEEDERLDEWLDKLDERENLVEMLDDIKTLREIEKDDVENSETPEKVSDKISTKSFNNLKRDEIMEKMKYVNNLADFKRIFDIQEDETESQNNTINTIPEIPTETCRLVDDVYEIPHQPGYIFFPKCIPVKRCRFPCCNGTNRTCVATKTDTIQGNLKVFNVNERRVEYKMITYENASECTCECQTECPGGMTVNQATCDCECSLTNKTCPSDRRWLQSQCACVCKKTSSDCLATQKLNEETCVCEEKNPLLPTCSAGTVFNQTTCSCS